MPDKPRFNNPYRTDIPIFLALIPFISAFNYYLTYSNIQFNGFLVLTFSIDTVQGYLAWWGVRAFILFLDKKWPYENGLFRRIAFQLVSTTIIGLVIISLLTELVSWIAKGKPAPLHFYTLDLVIISIWFFVINGIYLVLHYHNLWHRSEVTRREAQRSVIEGLVVKHGKQDLRLDFSELAGFYVDNEYAVACQLSGKRYYLGQSLDKIEKGLPGAIFFRVNRQFILHRQVVAGFKRGENGKILVLLIPQEYFPSEIPVSRTKAPAFKSWFRPE
ncbi:MAG: LytTR family transcriptional regulator [Saprospiraceae bacterium]|nr:LytTR family transcriptional regulator [Saprospiraceae bacterium]